MLTEEHGYDGFWYRCEIRRFGTWDEDGYLLSSRPILHFTKFTVEKETPKCVKLRDGWRTYLVRGKGKKQYACPTRETAWADCVERKKRHVAGCEAKLNSANRDMRHLMLNKPNGT